MYSQDARRFIMKLIRIQRKINQSGYRRTDQLAIIESIDHLKKYLAYYKYDTDEKMKSFLERNKARIRILIPGRTYPGYEKLINEFYSLI